MSFKFMHGKGHSKLIAEAVPVMIWACGTDKKRYFFNKSWINFTGRSLEEESGENWLENVHSDDIKHYLNTFFDAFGSQKEFKVKFRLRKYNGNYRWLFDHGVPYYTAENEFAGFVGSCTDIQEIKEADNRKDEFISAAGHEMKSPVTTMKAYIQMLQQLTPTTQQEEHKLYLSKVEHQINKLLKLIGDLLDLSKIQADRLQLDKDSFKFKDLLDEITENYDASITSHRLELNGNPDFNIFADKDRLGQVLNNLIDNAKKYSPHADRISLHVSCDGQQATISITDYGIGISTEDQLKIFDRFYRSSSVTKKSFPGLGIGLFLSMQIIRRHNGTIQVESKSGNGSTFILRIPVK